MNIIVNLNKDANITSQDAVSAVKRRFRARKAGHAGTLDPLATGVLLVCLNEATKITGYLSSIDKEYIAIAKLGETTNTFDSEGKILKRVKDFRISETDMKEVLKRFTGEIEQIPPAYSALKHNGSPLYKLARKGIEVPLPARKVSIKALELISYDPPFITIFVACSKGTYIRSLCNDIGNELGVGAHMTGLKRTKIGDFTIENSAKIHELPLKIEALHSIDDSLRHLPEISLHHNELKSIKNGNSVRLNDLNSANLTTVEHPVFLRLKDPEGKIFGIGKLSEGRIKPQRLFNF